ncbi:MAG: efflux RND transporter periplasmic adaptor subunit [Polyangiaceae bacterium]
MGSRCILALLAVSALPLLTGCRESASAAAEPQKESGVTWLTADQVKAAQIEIAPVTEHAVDEIVTTTGRVTFDDQRVAHIYSPVTGRVASVNAALGQRLKAGAPLATIVSPSIGQWSSDVNKAEADLIAAEHDFKRKTDLLSVNAVARADYEASEDAYHQAKAEKERAEQKAHLLRGAGASAVSQGYTLTTPIDGEVIARQLNPGIEVQGQYDSGNSPVELFTVGELDRVWVLGDIYEQDLGRVAVGAKVTVKALAYADKTFEGTVDWISGALDPATRTAHVRCVFDNPDRLLKPEMYANVRIAASQPRTALALPRSAVVHLGEQAVVYAAQAGTADGRTRFELLPVMVDDTIEGAFVPVEHGLELGASVVTHGAQALSSAAM